MADTKISALSAVAAVSSTLLPIRATKVTAFTGTTLAELY